MKTKLTLLALLITMGSTLTAGSIAIKRSVTISNVSKAGGEIEEHVSVYYNELLKTYYYNVIIGGKKKHFRVRGSQKTNAQIEQMYKDKLISPEDGHMS